MRLLQPGLSYQEMRDRFRYDIPERFNIGTDALDRHAADPDKLALIYESEDGTERRYRFAELKRLSNRLANAFGALGIARGDRVGILLGQRPETALTHLTLYRCGAIALPLFTLFGPDALEYRLKDAEAKAVVTDGANLPKLLELRERLPALRHIIVTEPKGEAGDHDFWQLIERGSETFEPVDTAAEEPALILYTSGTTGPPKGALHAHRVMFGHWPGIEFTHNLFPQEGDLFWTPADWAWGGGLLDVLLPSLHYGVPVLAYRAAKFDPERAFHLLAKHRVRNSFLPPTAMKMMRQVERPRERYDYALRSVASGGESLGAEMVDWGREVFGLTVNEFWGQTEANLLAGNCAPVHEVRPGSLGLPMPGHEVAVIDEAGNVLPPNTSGILAARKPDPVFLLEYWRNAEGTREKYVGEWYVTGDMGTQDADGFIWFGGRADDIISSGGYRIGPSEIEDCLLRHPAVALAAVIGAPDPVRGEIVKAFLVAKPDRKADDSLASEIQAFVRQRLAAHQYPRAVAFVEELPLTATGKVRRRDLREAEKQRVQETQTQGEGGKST